MAQQNVGLRLSSPKASGSTAHSLDTTATYSAGDLLSLKNNGTEKFGVAYDGTARGPLHDKGGAVHNAAAYATLSAALTAIGSDDAVLLMPPGLTRTLTADTTIPTNVTLDAQMGVIETGAFTLTVYGKLACGAWQAFDTSGGGTVSLLARSLPKMYPQWWGAMGIPGVDCTAELTAAITAWKNTSECEMEVPHGTYEFSTLPNLINSQGGRLTGKGRPVFKHTGAGRAVEVSYPTQEFDQQIKNILVECNAATTDAWYFDNIHHSVFEDLGVRNHTGAGTAAYRVGFAVLNDWKKCVVSYNQGGAVLPDYGFVLGDAADATKTVAACTFDKCIAEGVAVAGFSLERAQACTFRGGTSEGNPGIGVDIMPDAYQNTFDTFFCEVNTGGDFMVASNGNTFINCTAASAVAMDISNGASNVLIGGSYSVINIQGTAIRTHLQSVDVTALNDSGAKTTWSQLKPSRPDKTEPINYLPVTYAGTWATYSALFNGAEYGLRTDGHLLLRGMVAAGVSGSVIFNLPAGYRPQLRHRFSCPTDTDPATVEVRPDGDVVHMAGPTLGVTLDGILFNTLT